MTNEQVFHLIHGYDQETYIMFDLIKKIIVAAPNKNDKAKNAEQKKHIAACVLLLEASHIDNDCHEDELTHVIETIEKKFNLSREYAEELIELSHIERENAVDLWQFTDHINRNYSIEEKTAIMEDTWRIIHVDGHLEKHEDYFAHKTANLLRLTHGQLIEAKLKARAQLKNGS